MSVEQQLQLLNEVTLREAQTMFIHHARRVNLRNYKSFPNGFPKSSVKSTYVKGILVREFGVDIGFHVRPQLNQSEIVYDTDGGVSYIVAISSIGISNEQLVENVASRLWNEVKQKRQLATPWPPQVAELEQEENLPPVLVQLISSLKKPGQVEHDAKARALASVITYVTGSPTTTTINLSINLHGPIRSKELVDTFHKCGVGIGYALVLLFRVAWAVHEIELHTECPNEIAENTSGVIVVDNDDFRNDTLTCGNTSHHTNVMYVQPVSLEYHDSQSGERVKDGRALSLSPIIELKEIATGMKAHDRFVTHMRGEPTVSDRVQPKVGTTEPQSVVLFTHWFVQMLLVSGLRLFTKRFLVLLASRL